MHFWRLCLCIAILILALPAAAEEMPASFTSSDAVRTDAGVVITGERAVVDFAWLKSVNPDSVGWLYQEDTLLSEPIVQGAHNEYYLKRGFDKNAVGLKGIAFLDSAQSPAMDDPFLKIYGSARDGGRLESLLGYREQSYYDAHPSLRLLTPAGDYQVDVFACIKTVERNVNQWCTQAEGETFAAWLSRVQAGSDIRPAEEALPKEGEKLAVFTLVQSGTNRRVILAALRPITYDAASSVDLNKIEMDRLPTESGYRMAGPLGEKMVYAQNDTVWGMMRYESALTSKFRRFNGGGCGPTAAAILIANLVPVEELPKIRDYTREGTPTLFCSCSVNRVYCNHLHAPYHLETAQEYLRYLPVIMADFAAGNNQWKINSRPTDSQGSNARFVEPLCEVYGLEMTNVGNLDSALAHMEAKGNQGLVLCCALRGSPFTSTSHYVVVAGVDDTSFYVLDPLFRDDYSQTDIYHIVEEICAPGVVKISREDARKACMDVVGYFEKVR